MLFRSARGVAASAAAVFVAELLVFAAVSGRVGLLATAMITLAASVVGVVAAALLLAFPGLLTGAIGSVLFVGPVRRLLAPSLGLRLSSLLLAGALDGHSSVYRRANA